jgi:pyrimidine-nucleoside phosphorylase
MNPVEIIKKKRSGLALDAKEIEFFVMGYTNDQIPDYQMSAFLMAVYFQGMNDVETAALVHTMLHSGQIVDMSKVELPKMDKHSTGGIGDKTTIMLAPLLASVGVAMPTMSGRGLGHTGGTLDKLEAIPGMKVQLSLDRYKELTQSVGLAFVGQTDEICPADKKLYALRDVTGTVESIPLIVASIMSKKLSEGIDGIVFDVKCGSGAFMKTPKQAAALAKALVNTAKRSGKLARALITDMEQPLGRAVGNAIEINEAVAFLRQGPSDPLIEPRLKQLTLDLACEMYALAEISKGRKKKPNKDVRALLQSALSSGLAYSKFLEIISLQGGDTEAIDRGLPLAPKKILFTANKRGFVGSINAEHIGMALIELGGGRRKTSDTIDPSVGFHFEKQIGDAVKVGETIAIIYAQNAKSGEAAKAMLESCILIQSKKLTKPKLIRARL